MREEQNTTPQYEKPCRAANISMLGGGVTGIIVGTYLRYVQEMEQFHFFYLIASNVLLFSSPLALLYLYIRKAYCIKKTVQNASIYYEYVTQDSHPIIRTVLLISRSLFIGAAAFSIVLCTIGFVIGSGKGVS